MKFLKEVTIVLCFLLSTSAFAQWTGKYQLSFDETDPSVFYVEVVPDMDYVGVFEPQSAVAVFADPAVSYDISFPLGSWHQLGPIYSFCDVQLYDFTKQDQTSVTLEAGVPIRIIKFKALDSDCGVGEGVRLYGLYNNQTTGFDPCEILYGQLDPGLVTSGLLPEENSYTLALTGINNDYTNPLTCDDIINDCIEIVGGDAWNESINKEQSYNMTDLTYDPITIEGGTGGMFFDVYRLDNSFDLKVNGQSIATSELQFDTGSDNAQPGAESFNVRFMDGDLYKYDTPSIWQIVGTEENPMIRVEISHTGEVILYGSKESGGTLHELRLYNGAEFNPINWDTEGQNTIEVTQDANGWTNLKAKVYGISVCEQGLYEITKTADTNLIQDATVGDIITYTIQVQNVGFENIASITVVDHLLGGELENNYQGDLEPGQSWTFTEEYAITAQDIEAGGVYNQATVFGVDTNGNAIPTKKSFDPINGLDENDPNYNEACEDCTFTALESERNCEVRVPIDSKDPFYWVYASAGAAPGNPIINQGVVQGTNGGFVFDIYRLDNSFNMEINGVKLASQEIEFQSQFTSGINIKFKDGDQYEVNTPKIYHLKGDEQNPILRIRIDVDGNVRMFGSKENFGQLYELELINGNSFNSINWKQDEDNIFELSQNVLHKTIFDGEGYGINIHCDTFTVEKTAYYNNDFEEEYAQEGETVSYTFKVINEGNSDIEHIQIFDEMLGGYIGNEYFISGDDNQDGILNKNETWIYTVDYIITSEDINRGGIYNQAEAFAVRSDQIALTPVKSIDPNNTSLDIERPDHTYVTLSNENCLNNVSVEEINYKDYGNFNSTGAIKNYDLQVMASNGGFVFDIYRLDNSFNLEINGEKIANQEIEFQAAQTTGINVRFQDGDLYEVQTPKIYRMRGDIETPILRVTISPTGEVNLFGTKQSYSSDLYPLELFNGNSLNNVEWNNNQENNIKITQELNLTTVLEAQALVVLDRCDPEYVPYSIEEPQDSVTDNDKIKLYPNPVQHNLYIESTSNIEEVSVYNMLGQKVKSERPNGKQTKIDMESLQPDIYLIRVQSEGKTETYRIVKR